ncbi:MAG: 4-hydroxythreonine-4-phosphate dehydrogenase PdxA [Candidatus Aminicenantales bacterium]
MTLPRIGITLGDPSGIGPEVALKTLSDPDRLPPADYVVFGSQRVIEEEKRALGVDLKIPFSIHEVRHVPSDFRKGVPSKNSGKASFLYVKAAVTEASKGRLHAVVTAPVSKHAWHQAGIRWAGHTDYLTHLYPEAMMAFWSDPLKVILFTHHLSLKQAAAAVKKPDLLRFFFRIHRYVLTTIDQKPRFLVAGLNPHAGEEGLLGDEEEKHIRPAVAEARKQGIPITGPLPPDVVFREALDHPGVFAIAMYHDQGLIPFKLVAFERGVNMTLGLPFVRTSPDHGTAFDRAGKGLASPASMREAIRLAHRLVEGSLRVGGREHGRKA